ncbi:MAG: preprotein translocase subunit SecA [Clostridiales bacterium]|nr:preprotein translocase subunit SecA [Clostridiales bacterium]
MGVISFIKGGNNRKQIKKLEAIAYKIDSYEEEFKKLTDEELKAKTEVFKKRLKENYETTDDILPEAYAVVREASWRVLGMRHFGVQLLGGIALHQGRIAEMRTGEGKTLVATLPAYLNALTGNGVHVVTVNDYLAKRDAEWMGKVHRFLGLTVGVAIAGMTPEEKRAAYACDITYATNNELGFDYLRDNMVVYKDALVQRGLSFAIIDEVDSILIDEARTPLIISGAGGKSSDMYGIANRFVRTLKASTNTDDEGKAEEGEESNGDFEIDRKKKAINLTERGIRKAEKFFNIDDITDVDHSELNHYINNALRAVHVMKRDEDYIVRDGEVLIVDEFTGRVMVGRRYSDGLHQAIEAKENVRIQNENRTRATITFQNYFKLYKKLCGMTGTAKTEETEFRGIYGLDVVVIPPNKTSQRIDENDVIFPTVKGKTDAMIEDIEECYKAGQPVLVGTTTVDKSEALSKILTARRIPHNVLNAKNHQREAEIIAQAGKKHQVTIATNMAGRGTDILLGGNAEYMAKERMRNQGMSEEAIYNATSYFNTEDPEILEARRIFREYYDSFKEEIEKEKQDVIAVGGLRIIGTERHESRRIDNQLRGRAGRQGDVGSTKFYLSMEDDMIRLFGGDRMKRIAEIFKLDEDTAMEFKVLTRGIENAQSELEGRNFRIRKQVLEYDDVMNVQRTTVYAERNRILMGESVHETIVNMMKSQVEIIVDAYTNPKLDWTEWEYEELNKEIRRKLLPEEEELLTEEILGRYDVEELKEFIFNEMQSVYNKKIQEAAALGVDFEEVERIILLKIVDGKWTEHIDVMDTLRREIGLQAYGQKDPVLMYKQEGFALFEEMNDSIRENTVAYLMRVNVQRAPKKREEQNMDLLVNSDGTRQVKRPTVNKTKVRANDLCPCGSGKKYKMCCMGKDGK